MKKLLAIILIIVLPVAACAESIYPFGIQEDYSADHVAETLSPIFGDIVTVPGFESKTWAIHPESKYLYDFIVEDIQMYIRESGEWKLEFRLKEEVPYMFIDHIASLYKVLVETYGTPEATIPDYSEYDLSGNKKLRILYDESGAIEEYFLGTHKTVYYTCDWGVCMMSVSVIRPETGNTLYDISVSWDRGYRNAS